MSGLVALLDDIAALAKMAAASVDDVAAAAAKASAKAAGVVIDDTAVTPQYLNGADPKRELRIVGKIAVGSVRNKLVFILPALLLLSELLPIALVFLLLLGGCYLCYEGAHKVWAKLAGHHEQAAPSVARGEEAEKRIIGGAIRTDFILSAEIMVIASAEVADKPLWERALVLAMVALLITVLVYGIVAVIVKMDDVGLHMAAKPNRSSQRIGEALVRAMPVVLKIITVVGTLAMLWVGGHIIINQVHLLGWHGPHDLVHHASQAVAAVAGVGGLLAWLVDTGISMLAGLLVGLALVLVIGSFHKNQADEDEREADLAAAQAARAKLAAEVLLRRESHGSSAYRPGTADPHP